ncbi:MULTISPECIES: DNA polymerase IV [unclassified Corynebacterium]|uniref:DNA polymerase IV n=1 Tax=unclassified Corynebacterium TaxID=2624378 RepID=UPI0029CA585B|nr:MULTISPECIES: DNA polymerase IV [unclassified Corynebacterium]WPF65425.1 DNA polymerase IV [Corynebacterium sp. 22KM0430]WPF67921.1 DNA polymerase IV [Corynebacterium sp. 21KM1197]
MQRWVLHIDMDAFYASCEQLTRPTLRGRPVLVAGVDGRGVVAGASYEARRFGAHSAMPTHRAAALVGYRAVLVKPRRAVYATASRRVFQIVRRYAGVIEQLSVDEAFLEPEELVGASAAEVEEWGNRLREAIREETGLPSSIGAGSGKQYAKIGSGEAKPDGMYVIPVERQIEMLHPLDVGKLWGAGPVTQNKLRAVGVNTIGDLAALTQREVEITLGSTLGLQLWHLARGHDDRPVQPRAEAKQISAEHTYPRDLLTRVEVDAAIERAAQGAHRRLLNDGRGARTVTVKLRMADFHIESRSATLPYATDNPETLHATAKRLVRYPDEVGPIRLVGVGYSGLETARQDVLFPELEQHISVPERADNDYEVGVAAIPGETEPQAVSVEAPPAGWYATEDVYHPEYGHGWVQGSGHGIVTVRFETRTTKAGRTRTFAHDDPDLRPADPVDSLDWGDWLTRQEEL